MAPLGSEPENWDEKTKKNARWSSLDGAASQFPFPHIVERSGSGSGKFPHDETLGLSHLSRQQPRPSRDEPIALAVFHYAAGRDERGKVLVKGCVAHAALRPELGEGQRGRSSCERRRDALIERVWHRL